MTSVLRLGFGVLDQALSSISNVLFLVAVARAAGPEEFGAVSFAYALFAFGLAVQRGSLGTLISLSAGRNVPPPLLVSVLWAVLIGGVGLVLGTTVVGGASPSFYIIVCACLLAYPQDLLRYSAIAERRIGLAVASDGTWAAVTSVLILLSLVGGSLTVTAMSVVWVLLGAGPALAVIAVPQRRNLARGGQWFLDHASELRTLGPDALLASLAPLILASVMAQYMSLSDVAAVRGANTLLGPAAMLFSALPVVLLPEMARVLGSDRSRLATAQAVVMSVLVMGWGAVLALLPDRVGEQLLGETWSSSRHVLLWVVLELVVWALASGPSALLGTYRRWRTLLLVRVTYLVAVAAALGLTVASGSVTRVVVGMLGASVLNCLFVTLAARREKARRPADTDAPTLGAIDS